MKTHTDLFGEKYLVPLQALTWKSPFAALMLPEWGKIETRSWNTLYRGPVLICASQSIYADQELAEMCTEKQIDKINSIFKYEQESYLYMTGVAIAVGILYDSRIMLPEDENKAYVKYNPLLFSHLYKDVKRIKPFEFKGAQKWKTVSDQETLKKIKYIS